ncbi:MAG: hypothetical protein P8X74_14320 [Reinekea sp.]|jgi:prolipoprotein diacylglyceryltransferase
MPAIVKILLVLAIAIVGVLYATRNAQAPSNEQAAKYSKIMRILIVIMMVGATVKYFFFR